MGEFRIRATGPAGRCREPDLGNDLVLGERRLKRSFEVLRRFDVAAALRPDRPDGRIESQRGRGLVGSRVGVREAAADRAACADLQVAYSARRLGEGRELRAHRRVMRDVAVRRERSDRDDAVVLGADLAEGGDATQIDERFGLREPELHEWQEAVAPGDDL